MVLTFLGFVLFGLVARGTVPCCPLHPSLPSPTLPRQVVGVRLQSCRRYFFSVLSCLTWAMDLPATSCRDPSERPVGSGESLSGVSECGGFRLF